MARGRLRGLGATGFVKIALVGGGGFRAPLVYEALVGVTGLRAVDELVLHDLDAGRLERIVAVIEGLARERGARIPVRTTTVLEDAVDGAGAVFVAIRVGGLAARVVDERVPLELGVLGQETVGPGGVSFALRTVPVMLRIAEAVRVRAAEAWFVNFTNPAGLVTEAVRGVLGERAVGICDSPTALWNHVAAALGRPASSFRPSYAGLNHLGWLGGMWDDGVDVLPSLVDDDRIGDVHEAHLAGVDEVRRSGLIPNDYLVYYRSTADVIAAFARDGARSAILAGQQAGFYDATVSTPAQCLAAWRSAKEARYSTYMAEVQSSVASLHRDPGEPSPREETEYGDVAASFVRSVKQDAGERLILGVRNGGAVAWLDQDATVEVPCVVSASGPRPDPFVARIALPDEERELMQRVREAERATLAAASSSSRALVVEAVAAHPVVPSREVAERIVEGYLEHHMWMQERFA